MYSVCVVELKGRDLEQCMGAVVQKHRNKRVCSFIEDTELEKQCLTYLQ